MAKKPGKVKGKTPVSRADLQQVVDAGTISPKFEAACFPEGGLSLLSSVKRLYSVSLRGCALTADDLRELGRCSQLVKLDLPGSTFPVGELGSISKLPLIMLDLSETPVTDADLVQVAKTATLTDLYLMRTQIGDAGLAPLSKLPRLQALNLKETLVTDDGLLGLVSCRRLRFDFELVKGSKCTEAGVDAAFAARKSGKSPAAAKAKRAAKATAKLAPVASPAVESLLGFFRDYEAWSRKAYKTAGKGTTQATRRARAALLQRWCTPALQAISQACSYGNPPRFGTTHETVDRVTARGTSTTITTQRVHPQLGKTRRQYTLRCVGGQWLLDAVKQSTGVSFTRFPV